MWENAVPHCEIYLMCLTFWLFQPPQPAYLLVSVNALGTSFIRPNLILLVDEKTQAGIHPCVFLKSQIVYDGAKHPPG